MPSHQIQPDQPYIYPFEEEDDIEDDYDEDNYPSIASDDHNDEEDDGGDAEDDAFRPNFPPGQPLPRDAEIIQLPAEVFEVTLYYEQMLNLSNDFVGGVMKINVGSTNLAQQTRHHPRQAQTAGILACHNPSMLHSQGRGDTASMRRPTFNIGTSVGKELATTVGNLVNLNTSITSNRNGLHPGQSLKLSAHLLRYGAIARTPVNYPNGSTSVADENKRLLLQKIILVGFHIQNNSRFAGLVKIQEYHDVIGRCIMALVWESVLVPVEPTPQLASAIDDLEQFLVRYDVLRNFRQWARTSASRRTKSK